MIRTIIVDDEILSRIGIQTFIDGKEDISVLEVFESARDALIYLRENPIDIVITDIEMSEMDGLEFIRNIRKENLAPGIIILSCHEDFSYAQEAIDSGTNSYLLKHRIDEEKIIAEVKKVYQKTHVEIKETVTHPSYESIAEEGTEGKYVVCIPRVEDENGETQSTHLDGTMLGHLLDGIVKKHGLGTLFMPYNKEMFLLFRFDGEQSDDKILLECDTNIEVIDKNMRQYIGSTIFYGLSTVFEDLKEVKQRYKEAQSAIEQLFYRQNQKVFAYRERSERNRSVRFTTNGFLESSGMENFSAELEHFLQIAEFDREPVATMKERLVRNVTLIVYEILQQYRFEEEFYTKWNQGSEIIMAVQTANRKEMLVQNLTNTMLDFYTQVRERLFSDELAEVMNYIETHLEEKISLGTLTEISCMSVPTFSKKFKDRTGYTAVEYINLRRIEKAKILMRDQKYTLEEIAQMTGFSNANYLVRVFKKVVGQTASDYRRQYGIIY